MTAGKQPSPMAKALSKVSGAIKGPEPTDTSAMPAVSAAAGNGASAGVASGSAARPASPFPTAATAGGPGMGMPGVAAAAAAPPAPPGVGTAPGSLSAAGAAAAAGTATGKTGSSAASASRPAAPAPAGRRVRLTVARVDPWSVMKISFLVSVAIGIAFVVMVAVLWLILDGMGVFSSLNRTIADIQGTNNDFNLMDYIALPRVMSLSVVIGVIDVILLTALSTLGAFLYNVCSSLVGGVQLTLSDD